MQKNNLGRTSIPVSRIGLGTAEIGFAYGIGDKRVPTEDEAIAFLRGAVDNGVTFFDTASYYGLAEERIGASGILKNADVIVETKCAQFLEKGEYFEPEELEKRIREQVESSLKNLRVDALPILMLHGPSKEQIEKGDIIEILKKLKQEGTVRFTGVSTRGEEAPLAAIASDFFDVVQGAYSILDQRLADVFKTAHVKGVGIVNRSVLLKGVLTPLRKSLPKELSVLKKTADSIEDIALSLGIDLPTLAIRFAISNPSIATTLIGTNSIRNLKKAITACNAGPLSSDVLEKIEKCALSDPALVDPARWPTI